MLLGGPVFSEYSSPDQWVAALNEEGYTAAYCPVDEEADKDTIRAYAEKADQAGIVIAEVGAWSNPLSRDKSERRRALSYIKGRLALADEIGARCCVNIAGSCAEKWDGPHPDNLSRETFDRIVATVREIIDEVAPLRTYFTLETMPWIYPHTTAAYEELLAAVGREQFAVHFDPVNLITSPKLCFQNARLIREFVHTLGDRIKSCHAKDVDIRNELTVHIDETEPGQGQLDYRVLISELDGLAGDLPLMLEHLPGKEEYRRAAAHIRAEAGAVGVEL